ncbi:ubiquitin-specific protease ubp2 [Cladophialophora chaetospira]|uniref:ubiquitinyl hydrolase 1 n=1 Tax=Cladophialophora chaetospira TaxID=386627 RepID=A0AA39CPL5_9EURO|nr:ubiquitin-specific protease ubp2 [Cladophialophora chaetospira]
MAGVQGNIRSFIAPIKGSGRTAPAFLEDLTLYAPWRDSKDLPNLLADSPLEFINLQYLADALPLQSCRHKFALKPKQSQLPTLDERPGPQTIWTVAAVCQACRVHLHVKVDYTIRFDDGPCPSHEHPLHHLVRSEFQEPLERNAWKRLNPDSQDEIYTYKCSSNTCSATVTVRFSPPVLRPSDIHTLVDPGLLRQRTEDAFRERGGSTEGMRHPGPMDVLLDLRAYLRNSWRAKDDPKYKSINLSNKRFIVRFGPEGNACRDVLEHLGFQVVPGDCWMVPEPDFEDDLPYESPVNLWLDNAEHELLTLIISRPYEERAQIQDVSIPVPAERELLRVLGCQDYDTHPSSRTANISAEMRTSPFIVLGSPMDLSDSLIAKAYQWQIQTDVQNAPVYLSSLKHIANQRQSTDLETEVVMETSRGRFDTESLNDAYRAFHLSGREGAISDEDIIGSFTAQLTDSPNHEHQLRDNLRIIGVHRNSKRILDAAMNIIDNYEAALAFLDANGSTDDEAIQALFAVKTSENKTLETQAVQAVRLIAEHRKSGFLSNWIASGFSAESQHTMDAAEGYQVLQIDNRTIEDDMILMQYTSAVTDNPASVDRFNQALTAIARERQSPLLLEQLQNAGPKEPQGTLEEPVGLENIGNTCYLNSLLQFLFTMNELRQLVLDFDKYKMSLDEKSMETKRVGQRKVSVKEVQSAQKFVASLASLFRGMIQTPQSSIKPEQELARLTLETESVKEKMRRRSTLKSNERPSLGSIDNMPLLGPLPQHDSTANGISESAVVQSPMDTDAAVDPLSTFDASKIDAVASGDTGDDTTMDDNSSETTLVSKPDSEKNAGKPDEQGQPPTFDNKENVSPIKPPSSVLAASPWTGQLLEPTPTSKLNAQAPPPAENAAGNATGIDPELMRFAPPPGKPPPVPPRKPVVNPTTTLEEYARQQDVTEVMNHCIIQLSYAMRPTGFDKSGGQLDEVHDLFFGQQIVHTQPQKEPPVTLPFLNIITRVFQRPTDVYAAIDNEFDLQDAQSSAKAYSSIAALPPVLSIALDRVAWNNETKRQEKLNYHVDVPETIFMDRYLESPPDSDLMQRRQQTWEIKKELASLTSRRDELEEKYAKSTDIPSLLEDAKAALEHLSEIPGDQISESLAVNPNAITTLGILAENARAELEEIRTRIADLTQQIKEAFVDMRKHPYRLHAAFFHRGSAGGGHYWVYIYDHKKEIWRKYNDDRVLVVSDRNEIFGNPFAKGPQSSNNPPPNPYLLIYLDAEKIDTLAETVKRDIVYPPPDHPPPIPARNPPQSQMSAMPPVEGGSGEGDVEMLEYVNGGEHAFPDDLPDDLIVHPPEPRIKKQGSWDDSQLIADRPINW